VPAQKWGIEPAGYGATIEHGAAGACNQSPFGSRLRDSPDIRSGLWPVRNHTAGARCIGRVFGDFGPRINPHLRGHIAGNLQPRYSWIIKNWNCTDMKTIFKTIIKRMAFAMLSFLAVIAMCATVVMILEASKP
jgi:hypothetical protein